MSADLHVHTRFSEDSKADMEGYCIKAIELGISTLCFTDHVDNNPIDNGYGFYKVEDYFKEFNKVKASYQKELTVLSGMEFSEPHLYPDQLEELSGYPYDFILGSVHWIGDMFPCMEVRQKYSAKQFFSMYWEVVEKAVSYGHFDALAHIDFPKRYYKELIYEEEQIKAIFQHMVEKKIALEINTSSLRKGLSTTLPDGELLKLYRNCGGTLITVGSDAHLTQDLGAGRSIAKELISVLSLQEIIYKNHISYIINE